MTAGPFDFYPETEWRDDLEWGATELYFALQGATGLPSGLPHTDPTYYLQKAATLRGVSRCARTCTGSSASGMVILIPSARIASTFAGHWSITTKSRPALTRSAAMQLPLDEGSAQFDPSNLEFTSIDIGNKTVNLIPGEARARFNIRYNDLHSRPSIEAWVGERCAEAAREVGAQFSLAFEGTGDVFLTKPGPLVDTMRAAIEAVTGRAPALSTNGGTSDARFIKDFCPVVEVGLRNATAHQVDEHVALADLAGHAVGAGTSEVA